MCYILKLDEIKKFYDFTASIAGKTFKNQEQKTCLELSNTAKIFVKEQRQKYSNCENICPELLTYFHIKKSKFEKIFILQNKI